MQNWQALGISQADANDCLRSAVLKDDLAGVQLAITQGADVCKELDYESWKSKTVLHKASSLNVARYLVEHGRLPDE